ncbi:amino acid transporter [Delitschia confertaspora ATCC 74209]|uniref:Amino acid transporter n=1 Tax=Delitschia confertaspora ATCC 74209 TaxID=1513339 RepID=A0A9P4JL61_9PLEO|nr:amino acid transporter [Delitschia confertaspora ATCC 74209]
MVKKSAEDPTASPTSPDEDVAVVEILNSSGHKQELDRQFSLLSICAVGICTGNAWAALGGSIVIALYNGGPPGVIFEFIAVSFFYWMVASCIAELASAIPSSAGVYHWASVTAGKYGRPVGFFAGWWNFFGWVFGAASMSSILTNQVISMYGLFHPAYVWKQWHVFIAYLIITWLCCLTVMFGHRALPSISNFGLFFIIAGVLVTILVCAIMPSRSGRGHAPNHFVWKDWKNQTGWGSDPFVFCAGMLNGAFAVGTPDCVSHLAEELPRPSVNIPKAIAAQMVVGFVTAVFYLTAIFYSVNDISSLFSNPWPFPLAELYRQSTNSRGGSLGLLIVIFLPTACTNIGAYITAGRMLWTLGRDGATPFSSWTGRISPTHNNPFNASLACGVISTILGCIYVGSTTAFNAFVGSYVVLSSSSYLAAILPHILSRRRHVVRGPYWMPPSTFYTVSVIGCAYMACFMVIYCFPYGVPFSAKSMNYSCLISGGLTVLVGGWWGWVRNRGYEGPQALMMDGRGGRSVGGGERMGSDME